MTHRTATACQPPHRIRALAKAIHACRKPGPTRQVASAAGLALLLATPMAGSAADFTVANRNDAGPGSLRQAVLNANASPGPDTILFDSSVTGSILLTSGALTVTDPLTLEGPGQDLLTIDGGAASTILQVEDSLSIAHLKLANAGADAIQASLIQGNTVIAVRESIIAGSAAAGIAVSASYAETPYSATRVESQLIVENSVITGNATLGIRTDALLLHDMTVTVTNSNISNNGGSALDAYGYWNASVTMTIDDSIISTNGRSGISIGASSVQIRNTIVSGNTLDGISGSHCDTRRNRLRTYINANNSVIADNGRNGVVACMLELRNSTVTHNLGYGIQSNFDYYGGGSLAIDASTIASNHSGGVFIDLVFMWSHDPWYMDFVISNSTISGNHSPADGAGIAIAGPPADAVLISNSTVTGNTAAGIGGGIAFIADYSDHKAMTLTHSIVAGNRASADPDLSTSSPFAVDYSLIQDPGHALLTETIPGSNVFGLDPLLGPLADTGGPTETHGLLPDSPALDRGDPNFAPPPAFDQRGEGFDRVVNGRIDIGAVEMQAGPSQPGGAWLRSLGDTNDDGTPEIAVVTRLDGTNRATVKDAANGALISRFEFTTALRPVDVETLPVFGQGRAPHLVLLGADPAQAETRDALTGNLVGTVTFEPSAIPMDLTMLPDQDGNGNPELGMLTQGSTTVEVRDAVTCTLFNTLSFAPQLDPRQVLALPDLNGNGSAEVGVSLLSTAGKADRVVIKDAATGALVQTLWSGVGLVQAAVVPDRNGNGAPEVALLWRNPAVGTTQVWVTDAATGQRLAAVAGINQDVVPLTLAVVADLTGNGIEEYAVLGRTPTTGQVSTTLLDGATGRWVNRIWYSKECTPLDLASIADVNGNGAAELVMLGRCGPEGQLRAVINDTQSGQVLRRLDF